MKILRAVVRRGFDLGSAGYFTVLRPNTWFVASRMRNLRIKPNVFPGAQSLTTPSLDVKLDANDPGWVRRAVTILIGFAITVALLWWIMSGAPANRY